MRILAVDPGAKRLGIALSDPSEALASALMVIEHISRIIDAAFIAQIAEENDVSLIIVGQAMDMDGKPTQQGRSAARLAGAIRKQSDAPVKLWDESGSTIAAREAQIRIGTARKKRQGHLDEHAAAVILQSYLDAQAN